jgi:hypothetical protein
MEFIENFGFLSTEEIKELERGYLLIEEAYEREASPRKSLPGEVPQSCFEHGCEVALMPVKLHLSVYLYTPVGTILGYLGHDLPEETQSYDTQPAWKKTRSRYHKCNAQEILQTTF